MIENSCIENVKSYVMIEKSCIEILGSDLEYDLFGDLIWNILKM